MWLRLARLFVPPVVRSRLRRAEARLRCWLPVGLGGRFREEDVAARVLRPGDSGSLARLLERPGRPPPREDLFRQALDDDGRFCLGIFHAGALVACGWCGPQWAAIGIPGIWFGGDSVRTDLRRRGLGQILHQARLREAARRGIREVWAGVAADNLAARGALEAAGFVRVDRPESAERIRNHRRASGARDVEPLLLWRRIDPSA